MRVIIRCAGGASRWGDFQGVPKHLVRICGEPILHRVVRLTNDIAPDADIKIVVRDLKDRRYHVPGSARSVDKPSTDNGDVDKIASSRHLWDTRDRTVITWGDVWWSRNALQSVLTDPIDGWHAWLRVGPGGDGGELFAFAFDPDTHNTVIQGCELVAQAHQEGRMVGIPGGWALYRTLTGRDITDHLVTDNATHVTDWTEDMDTPRDWDEWCWRWAHTNRELREDMIR